MFYSVASRPRQLPRLDASAGQALERFLSNASSQQTPAQRAATIEDQEKTYTLQLDVPGLAKDQLDIGIEGDVVRVTSKEDAARQVKAAWRFPLEIDVATSTATLENGVLSLTLGKKFPVSNLAQLTIS